MFDLRFLLADVRADTSLPGDEAHLAAHRPREPRELPILLPAGMMGDRASIVSAGPEEISRMIGRVLLSGPASSARRIIGGPAGLGLSALEDQPLHDRCRPLGGTGGS